MWLVDDSVTDRCADGEAPLRIQLTSLMRHQSMHLRPKKIRKIRVMNELNTTDPRRVIISEYIIKSKAGL